MLLLFLAKVSQARPDVHSVPRLLRSSLRRDAESYVTTRSSDTARFAVLN